MPSAKGSVGGRAGLWEGCQESVCLRLLVLQPALSDGGVVTGPSDANEVSASLADLGKDFQAEGETLIAPLRKSSRTHRGQAASARCGC